MLHISTDFPTARHLCAVSLLGAPEVNVGEWHSQPVDHPLLVTREVQDVALEFKVPWNVNDLIRLMDPNLPWAEEHFMERVSGQPLNPPPSHKLWPWAHQQHQTIEGEKFSHTYPERYWPKEAGEPHYQQSQHKSHWGIRFEYGDLEDVVKLLRKNGNTRQAYLPVWFPEDTGAVHGERVPCSLGYHFLIREGKLSLRYYLRSCDFVRHFNDDMYMTARLLQWVSAALPGVVPGKVVAYISSLHIMKGDEGKIKQELREQR